MLLIKARPSFQYPSNFQHPSGSERTVIVWLGEKREKWTEACCRGSDDHARHKVYKVFGKLLLTRNCAVKANLPRWRNDRRQKALHGRKKNELPLVRRHLYRRGSPLHEGSITPSHYICPPQNAYASQVPQTFRGEQWKMARSEHNELQWTNRREGVQEMRTNLWVKWSFREVPPVQKRIFPDLKFGPTYPYGKNFRHTLAHTHITPVDARAVRPEPKNPLRRSKHSSDKRGHWFKPNWAHICETCSNSVLATKVAFLYIYLYIYIYNKKKSQQVGKCSGECWNNCRHDTIDQNVSFLTVSRASSILQMIHTLQLVRSSTHKHHCYIYSEIMLIIKKCMTANKIRQEKPLGVVNRDLHCRL